MISKQHVSLHPFRATHLFFKMFHCYWSSVLSANCNVIIISVSLKFIYLCNFNLSFPPFPKPIQSHMLTAALEWKSPRVNTQKSSPLRNDSPLCYKTCTASFAPLSSVRSHVSPLHHHEHFQLWSEYPPVEGRRKSKGYQKAGMLFHTRMTSGVLLQLLKPKGPGVAGDLYCR